MALTHFEQNVTNGDYFFFIKVQLRGYCKSGSNLAIRLTKPIYHYVLYIKYQNFT